MNTTYVPKALSTTGLHELCMTLKQGLTDLYGSRLDRIVLFGSYARGDFHAESDIDFLVVLRDDNVQYGKELWFMADVVGGLSLAYDLFISAKPTSLLKFTSSELPFYKNVRREGKTL